MGRGSRAEPKCDDMSEALTVIEKSNLFELEQTIQKHLSAFYEVGFALMQIRDNRYYRETHGTFEEYCKEKWKMSKPYATQMIQAAKVRENLVAIATVLPKTESQARSLTYLSPEEQRKTWKEVIETAPEGKVTAKHIEKIVNVKRHPPIHFETFKIGITFKSAYDRLVEEIIRENLNGWKQTDREGAIHYLSGLVAIIKTK